MRKKLLLSFLNIFNSWFIELLNAECLLQLMIHRTKAKPNANKNYT